MDIDLLRNLNQLRQKRQAAIVVTRLGDGHQTLYKQDDDLGDGALSKELNKRFLSGKSGEWEEYFLGVYVPPPRLVIIGAVHISQYLVNPALASGFEVLVVDPREAFANPARFSGVKLLAKWPEEAEDDMALDAYTAFAALTHDPKIDDFALEKALKNNCFYVGALGSKKTHAKRLARLREKGLDEEMLARIDAPIGLDIGAANPSEIAIAILGKIIATLRGKA